jgi:hypothetical protein
MRWAVTEDAEEGRPAGGAGRESGGALVREVETRELGRARVLQHDVAQGAARPGGVDAVGEERQATGDLGEEVGVEIRPAPARGHGRRAGAEGWLLVWSGGPGGWWMEAEEKGRPVPFGFL